MPTAVLNGRALDVGVADDPGARPRRRVFTAEYRLAILADYDVAEADGSKGSILRREGLHSSHTVEWRRARDAGCARRWATASPSRPRPTGTPVDVKPHSLVSVGAGQPQCLDCDDGCAGSHDQRAGGRHRWDR